MDKARPADTLQERVFKKDDQHAKGSAMGLIKADADAKAEKTARLRALRLAQLAAEPAAAPADGAPKPAKAPAAKKARRGRT